MNNSTEKICPDDETLSAFIDMRCDDVDARHVVSHMAESRSCRAEMAFVTKMLADSQGGSSGVSEEEHARIASLIGADMTCQCKDASELAWSKIRDQIDALAERCQFWQNDQIEVMAATRTSGVITFCSVHGADSDKYWQAEVALPKNPYDEILVRVCDARGKRIETGLFMLCGLKLSVEKGQASIAVKSFQTAVRNCVDVGFINGNGIESEGRIDLKGLF